MGDGNDLWERFKDAVDPYVLTPEEAGVHLSNIKASLEALGRHVEAGDGAAGYSLKDARVAGSEVSDAVSRGLDDLKNSDAARAALLWLNRLTISDEIGLTSKVEAKNNFEFLGLGK